jgi:hypothetical protein
MSMIRKLVVAAATAAILAGAPALAQGPDQARGYRPPGGGGAVFDLNTINNARVSTAQQTLGAQGFFKARSMEMNGRQYDLWYNSGYRNACVGFTSMNGWVRDARDFRDAECGFGNDGRPGGGGPSWGPGGGINMRDLEGLRVDSAKNLLRDRGFSFARSTRIDGRQYDLWWNNRTCVGFTSYSGRVTDARSLRDAECGGGNDGWGGGGWGRFDVRDLEGLSVNSAKDMLRREGFEFARSLRFDGRQYDLWYSDGRRSACVGFTSYSGRVTHARTFSERDCY